MVDIDLDESHSDYIADMNLFLSVYDFITFFYKLAWRISMFSWYICTFLCRLSSQIWGLVLRGDAKTLTPGPGTPLRTWSTNHCTDRSTDPLLRTLQKWQLEIRLTDCFVLSFVIVASFTVAIKGGPAYFKKDRFFMWAREMVMWYLSVDARFWQLSIHFDIDGVKRRPLSSLDCVYNWRGSVNFCT